MRFVKFYLCQFGWLIAFTIENFSFLEVRSRRSGSVFSVQDDGNTFDMLKGLIHPKS